MLLYEYIYIIIYLQILNNDPNFSLVFSPNLLVVDLFVNHHLTLSTYILLCIGICHWKFIIGNKIVNDGWKRNEQKEVYYIFFYITMLLLLLLCIHEFCVGAYSRANWDRSVISWWIYIFIFTIYHTLMAKRPSYMFDTIECVKRSDANFS